MNPNSRKKPCKRTLWLIGLAVLFAGGVCRAEEGSDALTQRVDRATDLALAYLAKTQRKDGAWPSGYGPHSGVTAVAVLAFLAKGYAPGDGPYGEVVQRGVDFVIESQRPTGYLVGKVRHGGMYAHGMATLMLGEVLGQCSGEKNKRVRRALGKAVALILNAQQVPKHERFRGGWRYNYNSRDSDLSCTGWQLLALRSAKNAGLDVPLEAITDAVAYIKRSESKGGGFGYQPGGGSNLQRAGTGILALELCGEHHSPEALAAGDYILKRGIKAAGKSLFYYAVYYCSQGMFQLGGRYWDQFWPQLAEAVLARQKADGSFAPGGGNESRAGSAYSTAMGVLALAVQYHYLPIYQR